MTNPGKKTAICTSINYRVLLYGIAAAAAFGLAKLILPYINKA
jgi:hypothetical protein